MVDNSEVQSIKIIGVFHRLFFSRSLHSYLQVEARRAEVLREKDRLNRIREAMHRAKDFIDIVRNDLAYPATQNLPSQNSSISQNLPKDTEGFQAVQSENTPSVTEVVQDSSSTTTTTAQVVQPATLSLAVLDDSYYAPALSEICPVSRFQCCNNASTCCYQESESKKAQSFP